MSQGHMNEPTDKRWSRYANRGKPYLLVLFLQIGYASTGIIVKSALNKGLNPFTFSVYRNMAAFFAFAPFALYFERNVRPHMTWTVFLKIMALAQLEPAMGQILNYAGMKYTTATFTTAMCNTLPALTFFMAWIFRLEKVNIKRLHSQAKIVGTLVTVGGAMIMTLVNGPPIPLPWTNAIRVHHPLAIATISQDHYIKGAVMITAGCVCWASFFILQAVTLKKYPAHLSLTTLICMMGALQGTVMTLVIEKGGKSIWIIKWDIKLFATLYSGIVQSGAGFYISGLVMKEKGPFFVTAFNPLGMVITVIVSSFTLAEQLDWGRVVGALTIFLGLYLIIYGKSKDPNLSDLRHDQAEMVHQETIRPDGILQPDIVDPITKEDPDVKPSIV